jgi:hypothetical protein
MPVYDNVAASRRSGIKLWAMIVNGTQRKHWCKAILAGAILLLFQAVGVGQVLQPSCSRAVPPPPPPPGSEMERAIKNAPLRPAQLEGKWGYVDPSGKFVIPAQFDCAELFSDGIALVEVNKRFGYIGADGKFVIQPKYFAAEAFKEGFAWVMTGKPLFPFGRNNEMSIALFAKMTFIDKSGREMRRPFFVERYRPFFEGLAAVRPGKQLGGCGEKVGFMNTKGEWAIKPQFEDTGDFSEGLAAVTGDGRSNGMSPCSLNKWGYIDKNGTLVIPFRYDHAGYFNDSHACVIEGEQWKLIDRSGDATPVEKKGCDKIYPYRPVAQ